MIPWLLIACSSEPPAPEVPPITGEEVSAAAAVLLCQALAGAEGVTCAADGAAVTVGERTLSVPVEVTGTVAVAGREIGMGARTQQIPGEVQLTANVAMKIDGAALAHQEMAHVETDADLLVARGKVLDGLLQRWMVGYGIAGLDAAVGQGAPALAGVGMNVPPTALEGATVWSAYPMLSGVGLDPSAGGRMGGAVGSMAGAVGPLLDGLAPGLHSVHVVAELGGAGGPGPCGLLPPIAPVPGAEVSMVRLEGTVMVDGQATGDICMLSEPVTWPLPRTGNQVRWEQFFVARVGG